MINKRLSAIALSALLAISSATSLTYAVPVNAAETTKIEASVIENEENLDDSVLTSQEETTDTGTSQDQEDDTFNISVPQQDDTDDIDDQTNTTEPVMSEEIGTDTGSGNEDEPDGTGAAEYEPDGTGAAEYESDGTGAVENEPGTVADGDETGTANESDEPETGTGGDEPGTGTEGGEPIVAEDLCATDGHSWDSGTIETAAACTTKGKIVFACTRCGETQVEVIPAKGHTFGEWTVVKKATTRVDGMRKRTCAECGETQSKVIPHTILKVKTIKLSRTATTVFRGKTFQLSATVAPANATLTAVTWKSSNTKVATVSGTGKVTAKGKGTATITCTAKDGSGVKASCKVTVKQPVTKITLNKSSLSITRGKTYQLKATVAPTTANNKAVAWKSSNVKVAAVSSTGKVTAKGKGTATITCTAKDGSGKKASCKVTVKQPVTKITLNKSSLSITKGKTYQLKATVAPTNANNKTVAWKSSNTKVAAVSSTGKVTAKGKGTATITCTAKDGSGKKASCKITVTVPKRSSNTTSGGNSSGSSETVWVSATGSKYHNKNNCGTMNPSKARQMSLSEAISRGLDACKKCFH